MDHVAAAIAPPLLAPVGAPLSTTTAKRSKASPSARSAVEWTAIPFCGRSMALNPSRQGGKISEVRADLADETRSLMRLQQSQP